MQARIKTTKLGFALALVILASISLAGYLNTRRLLESSRRVEHTHRVLELLSETQIYLTDAETGQRGYVITGDRTYLKPYDAAVGVIHQTLGDLLTLTSDNRRQQERILVLEQLVGERLARLKLTIDLRDKEGAEAASRSMLSGEGKELMEGIREMMGEIGREEKVLLSRRRSAEEAGTRNMVVTLAVGSVVAFALLFWVFHLLTREIAETRRLVEERDRFFNLSLDMLCIAGFDGYFKRLNPAWERTLGFSNEELMSKPFMEFVHPDDRPATIAKSQEVNQGGQAISFENRYLCKDGSYRWLSWNAKPSTDLQHIFAAARDVTVQKQAQTEIRQLNQSLREQTVQLESANKELEAFAYSVSHDLRAPLRGIDGFSQALLEDCHDKLDETHKGYLQRVRAASQRMALLIDDLLKLSQVTRSEMHRGTVDLSAMVREVALDLQKSQDGRQVRFAVKDGLVVNGDARLLRVALDNLLGNAWKFTSKRSGAEIEFGSVAHNGSAAFFVRDNGAGFDMAYAGKLFGPFQRLHSAHEFDGTGIGLATVQRIVHRHGGKIWAEGAVEKGATFYFTL